MDNSSVFQLMLDEAIKSKPSAFENFDRTKNVQDQLQEMVSENMNHVVKQIGIVNCLRFKGLTQMMSMSWEQLWLSFVQKELRNKVWDGETWIVK